MREKNTLPQFKLSQFDWDKQPGILTAEMSSLQMDLVEPLIQICSEKTGRAFTFEIERFEKDAEGDLQMVVYKPMAT